MNKAILSEIRLLKTDYGAEFAAYLNMAQHNAFNILSNISDRLDLEDEALKDDSTISRALALRMLSPTDGISVGGKKTFDVFIKPDAVFSDGRVLIALPLDKNEGMRPSRSKAMKAIHQQVPVDDLPYLVERLQHYFPLLKKETSVKNLGSFLQKAFNCLRSERNFFSHFIYEKRKKWAVDIRPFSKEALSLLMRNIERGLEPGNDPYRGFSEAALTESFGDVKTALQELENTANQITLWNTEEAEFTPAGLAFFICLFLEKKYAPQFLAKAKIEIIDGLTVLKKRFVEEWFWQFCCKIPRPRLESSDPMLDMLNELGRCPKGLYNRLSEADKALFHIAAEVADETGIARDETVKFIRHNDRFANLALTYMDDSEAFERLRFHIHFGQIFEKKLR